MSMKAGQNVTRRCLVRPQGRLDRGSAFPFVGTALNSVSTHPELLAFACRVIGYRQIMITHSVLVAKYAGARDYEQDLHVDYGNNSLVYPKPDTAIVDLPTITYYSDVTIDLGPTYLVPQEFTRWDIPGAEASAAGRTSLICTNTKSLSPSKPVRRLSIL